MDANKASEEAKQLRQKVDALGTRLETLTEAVGRMEARLDERLGAHQG